MRQGQEQQEKARETEGEGGGGSRSRADGGADVCRHSHMHAGDRSAAISQDPDVSRAILSAVAQGKGAALQEL